MSGLVGAVAAAAAVTCLALLPFASRRSAAVSHPEAALLRIVGWHRGPLVWELTRITAAAATLLVGTVLGTPYLAVVGAAAPSVVLRMKAQTRRRDAARGALAVLQGTNAALRGGAALAPALRSALERCDPVLREPFDAALRSFELNAPLDAAMRASTRVAWDRRIAFALDALAIVASEQLPSARAAALVASAAERLAFEQHLGEEIVARTSGVRAQIVLLALLVPALAAYLALTMPGLAATLTSPLGLFVLLPAALVFEGAGIVASRSIVGAIAS